MMSSEEETEFGLYTDKLLKKTKRTRQRVDAGEPRNSYSSIPNFSSRPSFLSGGNQNIYSAIFTQQQHFSLFGPSFGPSKMLNELLSTTRQKQAIDGGATAAALPTGGADSDADSVKYAASDCNTRCGSDQSSPPPSTQLAAAVAAVGVRDNAELAHHMLRDILQGRKHDLMADHTQLNGQENGIIALNNNQLVNNNNIIESKTQQQQQEKVSERVNNSVQENGERENSRGAINDNEAAQAMQECLAEAGVGDRQQAELMEEALTGMETDSLPSPKVEPSSPAKPEDAKKARVENIVSGMRSSPAPQQVNGCKKRKLYQPQQHDSTADRYIDPEEDDLEPEPVRQKRIEKDALKNQLRTMQEQLAEMQQKYVQLCTRMEQESDCQDVEEISSDTEDIKRSPISSPSTREPPSSVGSNNNNPQPMSLTQQVKQLKIGPPHIPPPFNGMIHHEHHHHPHMTNAAAMYLGVSHKLFLEQEARIKEAAVAAAVAENQQQQKQHEEQQRQAQQAQQQQACIPKPDTITERLNMIRNMTPTGSELEGLADALKSEITASLSNIIDSIVTRFVHQRRLKQSEASAAAEQLNKDLMMASQMLDRKSPRTKVAERPNQPQQNGPLMNGNAGNYPQMMPVHVQKQDLHTRPPMFQAPKAPGMNNLPMYGMGQQHNFCVPDRERDQEQNEALSLVVTPKKKRHKVTDTRITPRTVSRILAQDGMGMSPAGMEQNSCPSPRPYHQGPPPPPPPMLPVSLPTSVAIPNPGLHESQVFSPYSPFFHGPSHGHHHIPMQVSPKILFTPKNLDLEKKIKEIIRKGNQTFKIFCSRSIIFLRKLQVNKFGTIEGQWII